MASGSIQKRCKICRRQGLSGHIKCDHRETVYYVYYRIGKKQKNEKVGPNKKDAERRLNEILSSINNGTYSTPDQITFKEFSDKWLQEYARPRIKLRTYGTYEATIRRRLVPHFGKLDLSEVTQEAIEKVMAELIKTISPKTVNNVLKLMKTIMKIARKWKYIRENPAIDVENYRVEFKEMDFLIPEEISLLLKHSRTPYKAIFLTAILTGMRKGELLGLQWGDLDWNSDTIFVRRSIVFESKRNTDGKLRWRFDTPKTKNSVRAIVMTPRLKEALEIHRIEAVQNEWDLVFANNDGQPIDHANMVHREFHPALAFAGLRRVRFHDLRHTYTSLLISQGENVKFIQSQLGHASCQTTLDRYGHVMPVNIEGVGKRLDEAVFIKSRRIMEGTASLSLKS